MKQEIHSHQFSVARKDLRRRMTLNDLVSIFTAPRDNGPARKGLARRKFRGKSHRKGGTGNSKWHRRVLAAGLKGQC